MRHWFKITGVIFVVSQGLAFGATGNEAASFLEIPVGARPAALGGAYSALASDAYAPIWNPAGLGFSNGAQIAAQHVSYLESVNYEFASVALPLPGGAQSLGVSMQYLGTGDIPASNSSGVSLGTFSSHYAAYSLAYGRKLADHFSLGATAKLINAQISNVNANAYAFDAGSMYQYGPLTLAAVMANAGSKLTFLSDGESLPLEGRFSAVFQPTTQWLLAAEGVYQEMGLVGGHFGVEWRPLSMVGLRAGYRTDTVNELGGAAGFSTGIGLHLWEQEFDYAWVPYGDLGSAQYFSLLLRFGGDGEMRRNLSQFQTIQRHQLVYGGKDRTGSTQGSWYADDMPDVLELLTNDQKQVAQVEADAH